MNKLSKPFFTLTVNDLMTGKVVTLSQDMPLRMAAHALRENQISGAPVVDPEGRCVGVLSAIDFLRLAERPATADRPRNCFFQVKHIEPDGTEQFLCMLPMGACPVQARRKNQKNVEQVTCGQPECIFSEWQLEVEQLPTGEVRHYMTPDPVTVASATMVRDVARMMLDAHIHRMIVVDKADRPIGIVSSTDVLAAVAAADSGSATETESPVA